LGGLSRLGFFGNRVGHYVFDFAFCDALKYCCIFKGFGTLCSGLLFDTLYFFAWPLRKRSQQGLGLRSRLRAASDGFLAIGAVLGKTKETEQIAGLLFVGDCLVNLYRSRLNYNAQVELFHDCEFFCFDWWSVFVFELKVGARR